MKESEKHNIAHSLAEWIKAIDAQGYNVKVHKEPNYDDLLIQELSVIESFSTESSAELRCLSKCIRRYLWRNGDGSNSKQLYIILHQINQTMRTFAGILSEDVFWNLDTIMEYVRLLYEYCNVYAPSVGNQTFEMITDIIQTAGARRIIEAQWKDVLNASNGIDTFIKVFGDVFTQAITKYESLFFHKMTGKEVLCRMVKKADCDEKRFIPLPECTSTNRWNPKGRAFLYMSFGDKEHPYNEDLTLEEYVCLIECKTEANTACSFCRFEPTTEGRVLDLSYNDSELSTFRKLLQRHANDLSKKGLEKLLSDPEIFARKDDEEYIQSRIRKEVQDLTISEQVLTESVTKQYLKLICSCIYTKVDGTEEEKEEAYRPFHILSAYLEKQGVTGIIYPCTRSNKIIGKNVVLFNPDDARAIVGTIKRYFYKG